MRLSVKQRLLVVALLPASLLAIAIAAYFTYAGIAALDKELKQRGLAMVRYLGPVSEYAVLSGQVDILQGHVQAAAKQAAVKSVLLLGRDGRILAVSGRVSLSADDLRRQLVEPTLVAQGSQWIGFGAPILRSITDMDDLFSASATVGPEPIGKVFVEIDSSEVYAEQQALFARSLLIVLIGLGLAAVYAVRTANRAVLPLSRLVGAVRRMSDGDYQVRVAATTAGEFGVLENGFNEMAAHIENAHRDLQSRIEEATAHLAFQARHDALTNLINRREFEARLEQAIAAVKSGGLEVAVLFIDLDRFKVVNDTSGHLAGDELLRQLAPLLQGRLRERDTLARIGGDEFAVILPDCSPDSAHRIADVICQVISSYRFVWQDQVFSVGASIGLVKVTPDMRGVNEVLSAGDAACYVAKDAGRNRVHVHTAIRVTDNRFKNERWRERIEMALHGNRLRCEVTPVRSLQQDIKNTTTNYHLADIVISLDERRGPPISSVVLQEMAERVGLARRLDERVLELALETLQRIQKRTSTNVPILLVPLSLNTVKARDAQEHLLALLERLHWHGQGLCIALPEDVVIRHISEAGTLCTALRERGCKVALSDFGGWLASFNHLDVVRPDFIRINRGLTHDLRRHRSPFALVRAIQEISLDRGIATIAEVDDPESIATLREMGVHYAQGKAIAPVEPLEVWIEGSVLRSSV